MTKEQYGYQLDRAFAFASGRPDIWSKMLKIALDLYSLELVFEKPDHSAEGGLSHMAPVPAPGDVDPYDYPAWIVRKRKS